MKSLTVEDLVRKQEVAEHTYVRELWGPLPQEVEIKLKNLKALGFDLLRGLRGGRPTVFVADEAQHRRVGDIYEQAGERYEVQEVVSEMPRATRLLLRVQLEDRRGVVRAFYRAESGEETLLFELPAALLLLTFFKKRGYAHLLTTFHSSGLTTLFLRKRGEEGKALPFATWPPKFRRALREAGDILRKFTGTGRFTLAFFGQNREGKDRYVALWLVPTVQLFRTEVAEHLDKHLAALN